MIRFRDVSIRRKMMLLTLVTSSVALLLASAAFLTHELVTYRDSMTQELATLANVIGDNSTAALTFNDQRAAEELLTSLRAQEHIVAAALYRDDGTTFALYRRTPGDTASLPAARDSEESEFTDDHLLLFHPVVLAGDRIGTVFLQSDLEEMNARIVRYALIVAGVLMASLLVSLVVSHRMQRFISDPITTLSETAQVVSKEKDYSIRVPAGS